MPSDAFYQGKEPGLGSVALDCHPPSLGFSFSILWKPALCLVSLDLCGMSAHRQWEVRIMVLLTEECLLTVVPLNPPIKLLALSRFSTQVGERRPQKLIASPRPRSS